MKRLILLALLIPIILSGQARNTITNDGTKNPYWYVGNDITAKGAIGVNQNHKLLNTWTIADRGTMGSETYLPGWLGNGWKLDYRNGEYTLVIDNLDIRGVLSAREFLINQTNIGNGNWLVSSGAKVDSVGPTLTAPYFIVENVTNHNIAPFVVGDIIICQMVDPSGKIFNNTGDLVNNGYLIKRLVYRVIGVSGLKVSYATLQGAPVNVGIVEKGDPFVRIGNLTNVARQGMVGIYADEQYSPYIRITDSVNSWAATKDFTKTRVQIGRLYFTSPTFGAIDTYGLYAQGNIYLENGSIALSDSGYVRGGKETYADTSAGFYLGNSSGTPVFNLGNSLSYLNWDGSTLSISGDVILTNQSSISISGFNNDAGFITSADAGIKTTYSATEPASKSTGDFWFDMSGDDYVMKRYNGATWDLVSVYMDGSGLYAREINAGQVTAGTFTGLTFQTADTLQRVVLDNSNTIKFYDSEDNLSGSIYGNNLNILMTSPDGDIDLTTGDGSISISTGITLSSETEINFNVTAGDSVYINSNLIATRTWVTSRGYVTGKPWQNEGYIQSDFPAYNIGSSDIEDWDFAYSWVNSHYEISWNTDDWDTAYGWGNHASAGYLVATDLFGSILTTTTIYYKDQSGSNAQMDVVISQ